MQDLRGNSLTPSQDVTAMKGSVSNVDIDGNNTMQIKVLGAPISTFETLPYEDSWLYHRETNRPGRDGDGLLCHLGISRTSSGAQGHEPIIR